MKTLVLALGAMLFVIPAFANEAPRLRSFVDPEITVKTAAEAAELVLKCATPETPWRISCGKLVDAFNALGRYEPVADFRELSEFYRTETRVAPCRTSVRVEIAGVRGDDAEYVERELREAELCIVHTGTNTVVASAICMQFVKTLVPIYTETVSSPEPFESPAPPAISENAGVVETGKRLAKEAAREPGSFFGESRQHSGERSACGPWYDTCRKTGKAFWFGIVPAVAGAVIWCGLDGCNGDVTQTTTVCVNGQCR